MQKYVGRPKKKLTPSEEKLQARLQERVDQMENKTRKITKQLLVLRHKMNKSNGAAKAQYKQQAKTLAKRKKMYENEIMRLEGQIFGSDVRQHGLENAKEAVETVAILKKTAAEMKRLKKKVNVEKVEKVVDDVEDARLDLEEVNEVLAETGNTMEEFDDDELEAELNAMFEEDELDLDFDLELNEKQLDQIQKELPGTEQLYPVAPKPERRKQKDGDGEAVLEP